MKFSSWTGNSAAPFGSTAPIPRMRQSLSPLFYPSLFLSRYVLTSYAKSVSFITGVISPKIFSGRKSRRNRFWGPLACVGRQQVQNRWYICPLVRLVSRGVRCFPESLNAYSGRLQLGNHLPLFYSAFQTHCKKVMSASAHAKVLGCKDGSVRFLDTALRLTAWTEPVSLFRLCDTTI
jgi:hypothetical protein